MAKKKPKLPAPTDMGDFTLEEIGAAAYVLTELISEVNSTIDKGGTYDILLGFLLGPMDSKGAKRAGKQIRSTARGSNATH